MTPFEDGLIKALEHIGNTDWKGNIFNLIGILIASGFSAWAAFMIAKNQTEKQIAKQNTLETKKGKRMLATQIRLDKYEDLYESLTEYARLVNQSYLNVLRYAHPDDYSEKKTLDQIRIIEDDFQKEIGMQSRRTEILSAYHPEIKEDWKTLNKLYGEMSNIIYDGFTYPGRSKPVMKDNSFNNLRSKNDLFNLQAMAIQDMLANATVKIIRDLESDL